MSDKQVVYFTVFSHNSSEFIFYDLINEMKYQLLYYYNDNIEQDTDYTQEPIFFIIKM